MQINLLFPFTNWEIIIFKEKMTVNSSFLPKLLIHTADYTAQSANDISFPLELGSNLSPLSFIRSGWLINHLPRQVPFPFIYSFIHASIHSKDICWVLPANKWATGLILLFLNLTYPWGHTPSLQMANWDPNKFVNLLDQVCTMPKLIPILLLYTGQKKATDE